MQENKQEKSQIKQKILLYLQNKGISAYEFYKKTGVTRGVLTQNNGINEDNLLRFLAYAQDINPNWLLTGRGEMLKTNDIVETTPQSTPIVEDLHTFNKNTKKNEDSQDNPQLFSQLLDTVKQQAEEIGQLKARINELERSKGVDAGDAQSSGIANVG